MNQAFAKYANIFDQIFSHKRADVNRINNLASLLKGVGVNRILDVGCGGGKVTQLLADNGLNVTGVDSSDEMIFIAENNNKGSSVNWICENYFDFERAPFRFNGVTALYSFIQTFPSKNEHELFFELVKEHIAPHGYGFVEFQNKQAVQLRYPFYEVNSWVSGGYSVDALSKPIDQKSYLLQFTIKNKESKEVVAVFEHRISYVSINMIKETLHKNGMNIVRCVDAFDFSSEVNVDLSLNIGCLFSYKQGLNN